MEKLASKANFRYILVVGHIPHVGNDNEYGIKVSGDNVVYPPRGD